MCCSNHIAVDMSKKSSGFVVTDANAGCLTPEVKVLLKNNDDDSYIPELLTNKFRELPNQIANPFEYPRNKREPGALVVFNQKHIIGYNPRSGTDADVKELLISFGRMGFNIYEKYLHKDLDRRTFLERVKNIAQDEFLDNVNCLVVVVLTHGEPGDRLITTDGGFIFVSDITSVFSSSPHLTGKPKLFLIQACKGEEKTDMTQQVDSMDSSNVKESAVISEDKKIVTDYTFNGTLHDDMLIVYSTVEGKVSWRHTEEGSWLIQEFCRNMSTFGRTEDVVSIITRTLKCIASIYYSESDNNIYKQMPVFISTLTKDFYLTRSTQRNFLLHELNTAREKLERSERILEKLRALK